MSTRSTPGRREYRLNHLPAALYRVLSASHLLLVTFVPLRLHLEPLTAFYDKVVDKCIAFV
ncbi:TPA: hypothetical protein ACOR9D_000939 [Salmonella enterica]|nr:hypothetical protein [Salmonella enterica subsp. enterica serovar Senftenberg]EEN1179752.1 hypothetical protein [Salmonella enterica subsp. enterica serovar Senftenberg]